MSDKLWKHLRHLGRILPFGKNQKVDSGITSDAGVHYGCDVCRTGIDVSQSGSHH